MDHALARTLSILGHPLLVLPLAALGLQMAAGQTEAVASMALGFGVFAVVVLGWSSWQVRRGCWKHVDASSTGERRSLNRFLLLALLLASAAAAVWVRQADLTLALGLSAVIVAIALLGARWCKLSLHLGFAVFAALLLWHINPWASAAGLGFAAALAWSRLRLQRHVPRDLVAGAAAGLLAGLAFFELSRHLSA